LPLKQTSYEQLAGESGRGFAKVASEVKNLDDQTSIAKKVKEASNGIV
jgi:methyl-accepting chemotaxis protein